MKLLLFDIDGTLLLTHGLGRRTIAGVLEDLTGRTATMEGIPFSGRTDLAILSDVLRINGIPPTPEQIETLITSYEIAMTQALLRASLTRLPGTAVLLQTLAARPDVCLGLLTGNVEAMAYRKLEAVGLASFFAFGAFGGDHPERPMLPPIAMDRAAAHTGHRFAGPDVVIIGDTEHDIHCGRGVGARSVAVCTGGYTEQDLAAHEPDVLLPDLADTEAFLEAVLA
ncbi:MAG: HAD hydrolase-like protein [Bacteroidota bacterium]